MSDEIWVDVVQAKAFERTDIAGIEVVKTSERVELGFSVAISLENPNKK
jgi:hypothetical protein